MRCQFWLRSEKCGIENDRFWFKIGGLGHIPQPKTCGSTLLVSDPLRTKMFGADSMQLFGGF